MTLQVENTEQFENAQVAVVQSCGMGAALAHTACANHRVMDGYLPLKTQSMRCIILSHPYHAEVGIAFPGHHEKIPTKKYNTRVFLALRAAGPKYMWPNYASGQKSLGP